MASWDTGGSHQGKASGLLRVPGVDRHRGQPLRRAWLDQPYGEEEITRLEEEMLPALKRFVARIADIDDWILVEMEFMQRCRLESERMHIAGMRPALR